MAESKTRKDCHSKPEVAFQQHRPIIRRDQLRWRSENGCICLYHQSDVKPLVVIEPDPKYPGLFRIRYPNGDLSDVVNLSRVKDGAMTFALRSLNRAQSATGSSKVLSVRPIRLTTPS
jgi:hypothetical protein